MIITILGADFSASNIGTISSYLVRYTGNVTGNVTSVEKNDAGTSAKNALSATITMKSGFTYESLSVTVGGSTITGYTATDNGNGTVSLTVPANLITGTVVVSVVTTGSSVNPPSGETPSVPTTTTWYVDHRNNGSLLTTTVNKAGRGWCHEVGTPAYNAYVGKPVNTVSFFTKLASQQVTVMVGATNSSEENCKLIGTFTATNPNGTSKGLATITFPTVTLNQGEHLILFAQDNDAIDFFYATKVVTDANGIADSGFHGRVPKVYGTGTAWQKMSQSGTYSLAWSIGYVI